MSAMTTPSLARKGHPSAGLLTNDKDGLNVRVFDQNLADGVNVRLVFRNTTIGDGVLSVTRQRGAVTIRQIINNELASNRRASTGLVLSPDIGQELAHRWHLGCGIPAKQS
jgi:hypothetical protein